MKGIFRPIDYRTHEQDVNHIHYGKSITILGKDKRQKNTTQKSRPRFTLSHIHTNVWADFWGIIYNI